MKPSPRLMFCVLISASLGLFAGCNKSKEAGATENAPSSAWAAVSPGVPAPAWKLRTVDGAEVSSAEFKGKIMVVDFWATWCPPCVEETPGFVALHKKYSGQGVSFVGISVDAAGPAVVKKFIADKQVGYPVVMVDDAVATAFGGVEALPTTFVVDREGKIVFRKVGGAPAEALETILAKLLK